ncbi:NlpC/P60 family protein [Lactobacillus sp. CRM56-3]|uniref:NlpC/P60 family protein n=2 Tax=Secundilactobacillus folii TaxID=2678357 RepID=A0A7X2XU87_9LACO|nr:NlpC/P60 family protein [Secundilactobacillus folii]
MTLGFAICLLFTTSIQAQAADSTLVSQSNMTAKTYVRKSTKGATYNLSVSGSSVVFSKKTHSLTNYPNTTWEATKKMSLKRSGVTYLYYYVTNKGNTAHGWIWHGYLKAGATAATVIGTAKKELGKPYSWGGNGPSSFDCSGLTTYVYKNAADKTLPRTAQAQYNQYAHVSSSKIKDGDLAFFGSSKSNVSHVGIVVSNGKMIDAQNYGVITEAISAPWWHLEGYARPMTLS